MDARTAEILRGARRRAGAASFRSMTCNNTDGVASSPSTHSAVGGRPLQHATTGSGSHRFARALAVMTALPLPTTPWTWHTVPPQVFADALAAQDVAADLHIAAPLHILAIDDAR